MYPSDQDPVPTTYTQTNTLHEVCPARLSWQAPFLLGSSWFGNHLDQITVFVNESVLDFITEACKLLDKKLKDQLT